MCQVIECDFTYNKRFVGGEGWTVVAGDRNDCERVGELYHLILRHHPSNACLEEFLADLAALGFEEIDGLSPIDDYPNDIFWEDGQIVYEVITLMIDVVSSHLPLENFEFGYHWSSGGCIGFWPREEES